MSLIFIGRYIISVSQEGLHYSVLTNVTNLDPRVPTTPSPVFSLFEVSCTPLLRLPHMRLVLSRHRMIPSMT